MMKPLTATPHGILDYLLGITLVASPWLFNFNDVSTAATQTMVAMGGIALVVSFFTNYPLGVIKAIPFHLHGVLESIGALALIASPWFMAYSEVIPARNVALIAGVGWIAVVSLTNYSANLIHFSRPVHEPRRHRHVH